MTWLTEPIAWGFAGSTCLAFWVFAVLQMRTNAAACENIDNLRGTVLRHMGCLIDWDPDKQRKRGETMSEPIHRESDIIQWGVDRNIYGGSTPQRQARKFLEEVIETAVAIAMGDHDGTVDGIGDTVVCLVHQARFLGVNVTHCIEHSFQQIKDRGGEMRSGVFVKEADLAGAPPCEGVEPDMPMSREDAVYFVLSQLQGAWNRVKDAKTSLPAEGGD